MINRISQLCLFAVALGVTSVFPVAAQGQMEKRNAEFYLTAEFINAAPAVGSQLPGISFSTLEGEAVDLSFFEGKTLILVKAGYT